MILNDSRSNNSSIFHCDATARAMPNDGDRNQMRMVSGYRSPLTDRQIFLYLNLQGRLEGKVIQNGKIVKDHLPIIGVPRCLESTQNVAHLIKFFSWTHAIPERAADDSINRINVHLTVKGGIRSLIPFQQGIAMGSIVKGDILEKLEAIAVKSAQVENYRVQIRTSKQRVDELKAEVESRKNEVSTWDKAKAFNDALDKAAENEVTAITKYIETLINNLQNIKFDGEIPQVTNFSSGAKSPIDFAASTVAVEERGFETMNYHSQYYRKNENISALHDNALSKSSSIGGSINAGWGPFSLGVSHARASATTSRITNILQQKSTEGVLVVSATATTRYVKTFKNIVYDLQMLKNIRQAINEDRLLKDQEPERNGKLEALGISKIAQSNGKHNYYVYMLTEAVLGGSFTAIITLLDENQLNLKRNQGGSATMNATFLNASLGIGPFTAGGGGNYSASKGAQLEDEQVRQLQNTKICIEVITQGVIPQFARETIEQQIIAGLDTNPAKFEITPQDKNLISTLMSGSEKDKEAAITEQRLKAQNAQVTTINAIRALKEKQDQQQVHSTSTVFKAYDDFANKLVSDVGCGVPVGFYITALSEAEIDAKITEHENKKGNNQAEGQPVAGPAVPPPPNQLLPNGAANSNNAAAKPS